MKKTMRIFGRLIAAGLIATVLLSVFALMYDNSGVKETDQTGATAVKWKGIQLVSNMKEGISFFLTDENGFNNSRAKDSIDILMMGDSQMEATQVFQTRNMTACLERESGRSCYNIGTSGTYIEYSIFNSRKALAYYRPKMAVVIDVHDKTIRPDETDLRRIVNGTFENGAAFFESGIMYYLKQIPCVKPLLYGIKNWIDADASLRDFVGEQGNKSMETDGEDYFSLLKSLLSMYAANAAEAEVVPIILYLPSETLHPDRTVTYDFDREYVDHFVSVCDGLGIVFVDMTEPFTKLYETEHRLPHGFINTSVGEGHLNEYGHRVAAERLAAVISGWEAEK